MIIMVQGKKRSTIMSDSDNSTATKWTRSSTTNATRTDQDATQPQQGKPVQDC